MRIQLRHAGLTDELTQRLHAAMRILADRGIRASIEPWDGTQCDAVVLDTADAYGMHVLDIASARRIAVIAFGDAAPALPRVQVVAPREEAIARALGELFPAPAAPPARKPAPPATTPAFAPETGGDSASALVRLAVEPSLRHVDVEATLAATRVWLLRSRGRVLARHASVLSSARLAFGESGWNLVALDADALRHIEGAHSVSLDAFLLRSAWSVRRALPPFPDVRLRLAAWPDIGSAPAIVEALQIANSALVARSTPAEIATRSGTSMQDTSACLWAFQAAGLIEREGAAPVLAGEHAERRPRSGLLARLASHFGLSRP